MQPTLTWVDLTASDRDKMRRVLDLFNEKGTLDEMGLGSLRDTVSDALFPGTSYIQTRLRYVLFVPWIYQQLVGPCAKYLYYSVKLGTVLMHADGPRAFNCSRTTGRP